MKIIALSLLLAAGLLLGGCNRPGDEFLATDAVIEAKPDDISADKPLICPAESAEQAQEIAALYGIELVEYNEGLACFYTEEEPRAVIERGAEKGWPTLDLNYMIRLD